MSGWVLFALALWLAPAVFVGARLSRRINRLERRLAGLQPEARPWVAAPVATPAPVLPQVAQAPVTEPLAPTAATSDMAPPAAAVPLTGNEPVPEPPPSQTDLPEAPELAPGTEAASPVLPPSRPRESAAHWLSENGLAWVGGGALALGALLLVGYAAQRGVFTPALRVAAAVLLGIVLVGVSEWIRRNERVAARAHPLAAAVSAGAGAAALYAAFWAAYTLYGFIGAGPAALLLAGTSALLLGLSLLHGQPLALVAVAAAFFAPVAIGVEDWSSLGLTAYLSLVAATGLAAAIGRGWGVTGALTLAGALLWAGWAAYTGAHPRAATLLLLPPLLALLGLERRPAQGGVTAHLPGVAVAGAALVAIVLWGRSAQEINTALPFATGVSVVLAALSGAALQRGWARAEAYWIVAAGALLGTGVPLVAAPDALRPDVAIGAALSVAALAAAGALAAPWTGARVSVSLAATVIPGMVLVVSAGLLRERMDGWHWTLPAGAAAAYVAAAWWLGRGRDRSQDLSVAVWIYAAGAMVAASGVMGAETPWRPGALAALALLWSAGHLALGWRGFAGAASVLAALALTGVLAGDFAGAALRAKLGPMQVAAGAGLAAALALVAGRVLRRREGRPEAADATDTSAILMVLVGAFLLLRWWAARGGDAGAHLFVEAGLRTALLLAGGLVATIGAGAGRSRFAEWRGQALLAAGAVHGAVFQVVAMNPWWGADPAPAGGPPLLNVLSPGYLLPAALLAAAAMRLDRRGAARGARALAMAAVLTGVLWLVMEIRRASHGADLSTRWPVFRSEAGAYALLLLLATLLLPRAAERLRDQWRSAGAASGDLRRLAHAGAWLALALSLYVFAYHASPWWGPVVSALPSPLAAAGLGLLYASAAVTVFAHAREAVGRDLRFARAALAAGVVHLFVLTTLAVRFTFRGLVMAPAPGEATLETWTYSAAWAGLGVLVMGVGAARASPTLRWCGLAVLGAAIGKVFLFDTAHLEGVARAASFLALGAMLLAAAIYARRARWSAQGSP